jgi:hypothetical protein
MEESIIWFHFTIQLCDSVRVSDEIHQRWHLIVSRSSWPSDAAVFMRASFATGTVTYFLSPTLVLLEPGLVSDYRASQCHALKREHGLALIAGLPGAFDVLQ